jgi:hypothetical protein
VTFSSLILVPFLYRSTYTVVDIATTERLVCYAGKTYTMCGPPGNYQARGVIPRAIAQVFSEVRGCKENSYNIHVSYLEIYNDLIFDLLATLPVDSGSDCSTPDQPKPLNIAEV